LGFYINSESTLQIAKTPNFLKNIVTETSVSIIVIMKTTALSFSLLLYPLALLATPTPSSLSLSSLSRGHEVMRRAGTNAYVAASFCREGGTTCKFGETSVCTVSGSSSIIVEYYAACSDGKSVHEVADTGCSFLATASAGFTSFKSKDKRFTANLDLVSADVFIFTSAFHFFVESPSVRSYHLLNIIYSLASTQASKSSSIVVTGFLLERHSTCFSKLHVFSEQCPKLWLLKPIPTHR
jgi:hypothetical protein